MRGRALGELAGARLVHFPEEEAALQVVPGWIASQDYGGDVRLCASCAERGRGLYSVCL